MCGTVICYNAERVEYVTDNTGLFYFCHLRNRRETVVDAVTKLRGPQNENFLTS
jgi:hypothetical protein